MQVKEKLLVLLFLYGLAASAAMADSELKLEFAGVPGFNYSSDGGFGFGAIGSMFGREDGFDPYRLALRMQIFGSTQGQQSHYINFDWLKAFGSPVRLGTRLGYIATSNQNYCGMGSLAYCDDSKPFNENYYLVRYSEKFGKILAQYEIKKAPHKIELFGMYRGSLYLSGSVDTSTPYPGSLFEKLLTDGHEEEGYASVFYFGAIVDNRDAEASPSSGYWVETSLRESSRIFGSNWQYIGGNLSARAYLPVDEQRNIVIAGQWLFDVLFGDAPLQEIVRLGNIQDFTAFGGSEIGRGLREQYFPGRLKMIQQLELRYHFLDFQLFSQDFNMFAVGFGDLGLIAWRLEDLEKEPKKALLGFGGGLRLAWNKDFVMRLDLGLSPFESYSPKVYLKFGNVF